MLKSELVKTKTTYRKTINKFIIEALITLIAFFPMQHSMAKSQKVKHDQYFVCTRSNKTNIRNGPGEDYILTQTLTTPNMPLLVMHQIEEWVNVKLFDGSQGWVYLPILKNNGSCKSTVIKDTVLKQMPDKNSQTLYIFNDQEFIKVLKCKYGICRVRLKQNKLGKISGWIEQKNVWGVY